VRLLVRVRSDHDHVHRRFVDSRYERTVGGQLSLGAKPRSYQVTQAIIGRRRATRPFELRPDSRHSRLESACRQPDNQPAVPDVIAQTHTTMTVTVVSATTASHVC
jgi:hypothetical protein